MIGINFLLFLLPMLIQLWAGDRAQNAFGTMLYILGGLQSQWVLQDGEWWRMLTSAFLHVDVIHICANMFSLWQLGILVRNFYGERSLFTTYVFSGIAGSVLSIIFLGPTPTVGASGAVFGLMGLLLGGSLRKVRYGVSLPFRPMDVLPIVIYSLLIGLTPGFAVNNWAHVGGLVAGFGLSYVLNHAGEMYVSAQQKLLQRGLYYAAVIIFGVSYVAMIVSAVIKLLG